VIVEGKMRLDSICYDCYWIYFLHPDLKNDGNQLVFIHNAFEMQTIDMEFN